ncbi:hypothetical protein TW85_00005, partial [Marinomonas sp. S3726]|uniref:hypothetical protein n=1 Tax=Marinomonas sp. S3726 TaxID=579484 RepID=UPI0005F9E3C0
NSYSIDKLLNIDIGLLEHALWVFEEYLNGISEKVTPCVVTSRKVPTLRQSNALCDTFSYIP